MARRRSYLRDLAPSRDELEAAKTAETAAQDGSTWGSAIGTGIGAVGGGLLGSFVAPGLGTAAGASLGAGVGGSLGSAVGGAMGAGKADQAEEKLRDADLERQKALEEEQMYQDALQRFLETE